MKKILTLGALFLLGSLSFANTVNEKIETTNAGELNFIFYPVKITSSCGYTEYFEVSPTDDPLCWMVEADRMEDECNSPFESEDYAMYP